MDRWNEHSVRSIMAYVHEGFNFDVNTERMIESSLRFAEDLVTRFREASAVTAGKKPIIPFSAREYLERVLSPIGISDDEIKAFSEGRVPSARTIAVPVYATYKLGVKVWVEVPEDSSESVIKEAALEKIIGDGDYEIDESFDQQAEDVSIYEIDYDGIQTVDREEDE